MMKFFKVVTFRAFAIVTIILLYSTKAFSLELRNKDAKRNASSASLLKQTGIAPDIFAVHNKGLQQILMANFGILSNPNGFDPDISGFAPQSIRAVPELEYPGGSGTVFLFSGGLWVGATKRGERIVSTVTDGDNGTQEFGPLEYGDGSGISWLFQSKDDSRKEVDDDQDWNRATDDLDGNGKPSSDWDGPEGDDNGDGNFEYDPEPGIDEDPVGDISNDFLDNDFDGLIDGDDPDLDGDLVPGSNDDDGDGLEDEDTIARAGQEWYTTYVDNCSECLKNPDPDGFTPLGIRVVQHSLQWSESFLDDFIVFEYSITNISPDTLQDVWLGTFFDPDVGLLQNATRCEDDITFYLPEIQTAIGGDNDGDNGLLRAQYFGVRVLEAPKADIEITYLNFERLTGGDPKTNAEKYEKMTSRVTSPPSANAGDWRFLFSFGPLGNVAPGETLPVTIALINGFTLDLVKKNAQQALELFKNDFRGPEAPDAPTFTLLPLKRAVKVHWDNDAEESIDPITIDLATNENKKDFQGYRIWRSFDGSSFTLAAEFDKIDSIGFNYGMPTRLDTTINEATYNYVFIDEGVPDLFQLRYVVTAFDDGDNGDGIAHPEVDGIGILESPLLSNQKIVVPGSAPIAQSQLDDVYVVPNPYIGSSRVERYGVTNQTLNTSPSRDLKFVNIPQGAKIQIYTLAGDLVQTLEHHDQNNFVRWNMRTDLGQEVVAGIYLFHVAANGVEKIGKFLVVK